MFPPSLTTSPVCLGCAGYGTSVDRAASFAALDAFAESGGCFLDTAHVYAAWLPDGAGASERVIGEWLRATGNRDQVVIGTKGGHPPLGDMAHSRLDAASLESDLNESLERLGVDHVDVYWLHRDDPSRPIEDIVATMTGFIASGRVRSWGVSNWRIPRIEAALSSAGAAPSANQPGWALADYAGSAAIAADMIFMDAAMRAWHARSALPVIPYASQANGYFGEANAQWARDGFMGEAPHGRDYDTPGNRKRLLTAIEIAMDHGVTPSQIAVASLTSQPFPCCPIIGSHRPERIRETIAGSRMRLNEEEMTRLWELG